MANPRDILVLTTSSTEVLKIKKYLKPVSAHIVAGTNLFSDFLGGLTDVFGGRSNSYQKQLSSLYNEAIERIKYNAHELGGNCVIGLNIDMDEISGKGKSMFMLTAIGTAVIIENDEKSTQLININEKFENVGVERINNLRQRKEIVKQAENSKLIYDDETWSFITSNQVDEIFPYILQRFTTVIEQFEKKDNKKIETEIRPRKISESTINSAKTTDSLQHQTPTKHNIPKIRPNKTKPLPIHPLVDKLYKNSITEIPAHKTLIINSWNAFIKAQEVLTNEYSEPFSLIFNKINKEGIAKFTIADKKPIEALNNTFKKVFPDLHLRDVKIDEGFLLYDSTKTPNNDSSIEKLCEANYLEINFKPCFSGFVTIDNKLFKLIPDLNILSTDNNGFISVTIKTLNQIDQVIKDKGEFSRSPIIHGIFKVIPIRRNYGDNFEFISDYLVTKLNKNILGLKGNSEIIVKDTYLKNEEILFIRQNSDYQNMVHMLIVKLDKYPDRYDEGIKEVVKMLNQIIEDEIGDLNKQGLLSHHVSFKKNHLTFIFVENSPSFPENQINIIKLLFEKVLDQCEVNFKHNNVFTKENINHLQKISKLLDINKFKINFHKGLISFDFTNESALRESIKELRKHQLVDINFKENDHTFKVKLEYDSPLLEIQKSLESIPAVTTTLTDDNKLLFFCHFDDNQLVSTLGSRIKDMLFQFQNTVDYSFDELHEGKLKYFINFRQKDFEDEISNKFNFLRGEEISLWDVKHPIPFGKILKINYPTIEISVDNLNEEVCIPENSILVGCVLKGERDKIKRLSHTIDIIFSKNKEQIPNENLRSILIDASKADSTEGDILQTEEYQKTLDGISTSLLSKNINSRQIEAIAKCIISKDLFVIQGPPGTGKSTAISELIWQHIRVNLSEKDMQYRILVTSETNLAVDNALDKLRSKNHMLIKPIRFGSQEKLDKEGRHFCLESLKTWAELDIPSNTDKNIPSNIIEDWISIIANRSKRNNAKNGTKLMERWLSYLENSNNEIRTLFYNNYIKNANVIGATCSSIGKLNSADKPTRFMKEYCNIVYPEMTKISKSDLKSININFDLVVQDEASKASPPELALPCLFGKKAVVIGDHRQLPPMVNTNDFIDNLKLMSIKTKDRANKSEIESLIRFVKKNREEFSISHFEKLFNAINPNLKSSFNEQYRMHPAINETIKQFYIEDGGLECGIPQEFADLEDLSHPLSRFHGVTKNKNTHVIWIDVNTPEIKNGTSRVNHGEVQAIDWLLNNFQKSPGYKKFVDYWAESEIEQKEIGIITFYGAQFSLLNKLSIKYPDVPLRISPVDRFQGMERNIVIVSLVRSNSIADSPNQVPDYENYNETGFPLQESLGFAEFPNRLNVALSRAKRLLIIVGNSKHFRQKEIYDRVYETIKNHECGSINEFDTNTNTLKL